MSDDQLDDLKQFIDSRISQSEANFDTKIENLRTEMHDGFAGVGEAVEELNKHLDAHEKVVDQRLTRLEQQTI